jgi:hypothetical protein
MALVTIKGQSGGASLNYTVKAYAALADLPAAGKVNEIAVITSTAIGAHTFAALAPTARADGTALQAGDVWIKTGRPCAVSIDVLAKKNGLFVYGQGAYQYSGSAWTQTTAKCYSGSAWVDLWLYLYLSGDEFTALTGGWNASGSGSVTKSSDYMYVSAGGSNNQNETLTTANLICVTDINTVSIDVLFSGYSTGQLRLVNTSNQTVATLSIPTVSVATVMELDVSAISGSYYLQFYVNTGSSSSQRMYLTVYGVWM